jgi:hypothetical protein
MTKRKIKWSQYPAERDAIWAHFSKQVHLSHKERGDAIKVALDNLEVVRD